MAIYNLAEIKDNFELSILNLECNGISRSYSTPFFDQWYDALRRAAHSGHQELTLSSENVEVFQKAVIFKTFVLRIPFCIPVLEQCAAYSTAETIPISEFLNKNSLFDYSYIPNCSQRNIKMQPILVLPFPIADKRFLVADGNHRLSFAIDHQQTVQAKFIESPIQAAESIPLQFPKAYYLLVYETWLLSQIPLLKDFKFDVSRSLATSFL